YDYVFPQGTEKKMRMSFRKLALLVLSLILFFCATSSWAQSGGNIEGVLKDPSGAVLPGATVEISNPVSGYRRETVTGLGGGFLFTNFPFNPYPILHNAQGVAP